MNARRHRPAGQKAVGDFSPPAEHCPGSTEVPDFDFPSAARQQQINPATAGPRRGLKAPIAFLPALMLVLATGRAGSNSSAELHVQISRDPGSGILEMSGPDDRDSYYILEQSPDLLNFAPDAISLGSPAPCWKRPAEPHAPARYYRLRKVPRDTPFDTDGDGIDDVWELERPLLLNPLDGTDAVRDPDRDGNTHLDDYLAMPRPTLNDDADILPDDAISREVSLFNEGAPTAAVEAISQEVSLYNGETPPQSDIFDAVSREVSVVNLGEATAFIESISPEVSVFNFGSPPVAVEAISQEVSLYNGETPPQSDLFDAVSREISVLNLGEPSAVIESISREVSVFNNLNN